MTSALAIGDCGYAHIGQLPDAFAQFAAQRLGWTVEPSRVFAIPDVMTGLAEVVQAITPPGSGIVVNPPVYPPFRFRFGFYGRRLIDAPLARGADGRYALDPDAIEAALSEPDAAAYLLCSPHNPTGNVWSPRGPGDGRRRVPAARRRRCWWTRSTRRWRWPARGSCRSSPSITS